MAITNLKKARFLSETPQWLLAQQTGLHPSRISRIENGRVTPRDDELERLAEALDISVEDLSNTPAAASTGA